MYAAGELPRLRDTMAEPFERNAYARSLGDDLLAPVRYEVGPPGNKRINHIGDDHNHRHLVNWLRVAELYLVTAPMTQLCVQAGAGLHDYALHHDDPPARVGLLFWADPVPTLAAWKGETFSVSMRGVLWAPTMTRLGPGLVLMPFCDTAEGLAQPPVRQQLENMSSSLRNIASVVAAPVLFGDTMPLTCGLPRPLDSELYRTLAATWLMMRQQVTVIQRERMPRALRRQYERAGRPEPTVRTVVLRRARQVNPDQQPAGAGGRVYRHQWPVVGHWRFLDRGAYPGREPTWVSPHIKGPEGAPMIGGERVNLLKR